MTSNKTKNQDRRKLLGMIGITGVAAGSLPASWVAPVINSVVLPAHAQTSICVANTPRGGPLIGNATSAPTCEIACEDEADALGGQLCAVTETVDANNATQCSCEIDVP